MVNWDMLNMIIDELCAGYKIKRIIHFPSMARVPVRVCRVQATGDHSSTRCDPERILTCLCFVVKKGQRSVRRAYSTIAPLFALETSLA